MRASNNKAHTAFGAKRGRMLIECVKRFSFWPFFLARFCFALKRLGS